MRFFAILLEIEDYPSAVHTLLQFKKDMKKLGGFVVFDLEQTNYDFLYNSLIEKGVKELRKGG